MDNLLHTRTTTRALSRLKLDAGDLVEVNDFEKGHLEEVASISDAGCVYFRGGHGAREWPDTLYSG